MRVLLILSLSAALLCTVIFADHEQEHQKKDDRKHDLQTRVDHHHDQDHQRRRHHHQDHDHQREGDDHHDHQREGDHHHDHDHQSKGGHHHDHDRHKHHSSKDEACHKLEQSNKRFAYELFSQLTEEHPSENVFFSPVGISTSFANLALGAKGKTHDQILEGISFNTSEIPENDIHDGFRHLLEVQNAKDSEFKLKSGNGLFVNKKRKILDDFLENSKKFYQAEPIPTDFEDNEGAKKKINSYVEKNTDGKIVDMMSSVNRDAVFVLANYITFSAQWLRPFEKESTEEGDFHVNENETIRVPFMKKTGFFDLAYLDDATVLLLHYKGNASAMFILPNKGKVRKVEANLHDIVQNFKKAHKDRFAQISLPKFSVSASYDLQKVMEKRGVTDVFSDQADLSGITGTPNIKISQARHTARISVDEKGTEAAGATVLEAIPMMLPPKIEFNEPFYVIIYHYNTRAILFLLKLTNPL